MTTSELAKKIALMWFGKMSKTSKEFDAFVKHTSELLLKVQVKEKEQDYKSS